MKRWTIGIMVAVGILAGTLPVRGDDFVFGDSSPGSSGADNILRLTLSGGGSVNLFTGPSLLFPGDKTQSQGWWSPTFGNYLQNTNYIVGNVTRGTTVFNLNDFFTFDVSSLSGQTVTGAVLSVVPFDVESDTGRTQQIVSFFDVSTDATTLNNTANANSPNAAIFADLGSGTLYGTHAFPIGFNSSSYTDVTLNASAVADINAAIGRAEFFSIGGTLAPLAPVPEPCTLAIWSLLGGIGAIVGYRRRKAV